MGNGIPFPSAEGDRPLNPVKVPRLNLRGARGGLSGEGGERHTGT